MGPLKLTITPPTVEGGGAEIDGEASGSRVKTEPW